VTVAVRVVRVMEMAVDHVVEVVVVNDGLMSAARTVLVPRDVAGAAVRGGSRSAALVGMNVLVLHAHSNGRLARKISPT
jgi:hypothetical protein